MNNFELLDELEANLEGSLDAEYAILGPEVVFEGVAFLFLDKV
jgi:hypothetical protein